VLIDEATSEMLIAGGRMSLRVPVRWRGDPHHLRAQVAVDAPDMYGAGLVLDLSLAYARPWKYTYQLRSGGVILRRLDVRSSHVNHCGPPGRWRGETHKHRWTDRYRDAIAYTPTDIPAAPGTTVGEGEYRAVFEAFCAECNIALEQGYSWVEPNVSRNAQGTSSTGAPP
jgi:hypothetical protein